MLTRREVSTADRDQIAEWISQDSDHKDRGDANFWLPENEKDDQCFAMEDEHGTIFYVRLEKVLRLHVQFAPKERQRTAAAIDEFTKQIATAAKATGYAQLIFDSVFAPLIRFLHKRGFRSSPAEQVLDL